MTTDRIIPLFGGDFYRYITMYNYRTVSDTAGNLFSDTLLDMR